MPWPRAIDRDRTSASALEAGARLRSSARPARRNPFWQPDGDRQDFVVAAKGAPEAIAGLCRLGAADRAALKQSVDAMASAGLRVLGVARATHAGPNWPDFAARI